MRKTLTLSVGMVVALLLTACGGGETDTEAAPAVVIDGQTVDAETAAGAADSQTTENEQTDTATAEADSADDAEGTTSDSDNDSKSDEELALEFVACMRDNGIDFPDPQIEADGSVVLLPGGPVASGVAVGTPEFEAAAETCGPIVEGAAFLPTNQIDQNELEDTLLAFAACVREQGVEISDPDLSAGFPPPGGPTALFGGFDPTDPANADLVATCRQAALDATGFEPPGGA